MRPALIFRSPPARVYAVIAWLVAGVVLTAFVANGGPAEVLRYGALPGILAVAGWVAFWRPELRLGRDGVQVTNLISTTRLAWHDITGTKTRWGLELMTSGGTVGVWALPARSSFGRWQSTRRVPPPLPPLERVEADTPAGGDPLVVADLIDEHRTGFTEPDYDGRTANRTLDRRLDPVPAGLLLASAGLALVTLLS